MRDRGRRGSGRRRAWELENCMDIGWVKGAGGAGGIEEKLGGNNGWVVGVVRWESWLGGLVTVQSLNTLSPQLNA